MSDLTGCMYTMNLMKLPMEVMVTFNEQTEQARSV